MLYIRYLFRKKNGFVGHNCVIDKSTIIFSDVHIGDNCKIGSDVVLKNGSRLGNNVVLKNIELGINSFIETGVLTTGYGKGRIKVGTESYIGINNILDYSNNIIIGSFVHIAGPSTGLWTHSSAQMCMNSIPLKDKDEVFRPTAPIVIENNVYIGGNCTIYPGVTIHHHSIITPNSAVNNNVESFSLYGGVPAKLIKKLY